MLFRPLAFFIFLTFSFLQFQKIEAVDWSKRFYLATYPRSGNHWMRYLIEDAVHITTGSVYVDADPQHHPDPLPWAGFCVVGGYRGDSRYPNADEPFVVKTHYPALSRRPFDRQPYVAVIRIVRHPIDSLYSWHVYKARGGEYSPTITSERLKKMVRAWKRFQLYWDNQPNVLTIRYEDMLGDLENCLRRTLKTIGYNFTQEDLDYAVENNSPRGGILKHLEHFSKEDLDYIQKELGPLMKKYNYTLRPMDQVANN